MSNKTETAVYIDVVIPVRSYLKKFIASHASVDPFIVSLTRCHFSCIFMEPLMKNRPKAAFKDQIHLNDSLTLRMRPSVMNEKKFWWNSEVVMSIDYRLKSLFDQQLIDFINIANEKHGDMKQNIFSFMEYYQLTDDDVKWDTLWKMYYRARSFSTEHRQKKMETIIHQQLLLFPEMNANQ